jgi:hypothetical protein
MIKAEDDTDALDIIKHIVKKPNDVSWKKKIKSVIKESIDKEKLDAIRTLIK